MTGDRTPSGCRYCGVPERGHFQRWASPHGWHTWEPPTDAQTKQRMLARRADRIAARAARYEVQPTGDLREQLAEALTREHYRRASERIEAPPEEHCAGFADAVLPVVEAETADAERRRDQAENRAALFREQVRMEHERAEEAERQRDEALAAVQRVGRELGGLCEFLAGWTDEHNANVTEHEIKSMRFAAKEMRRILAALDQPADSPAKETP